MAFVYSCDPIAASFSLRGLTSTISPAVFLKGLKQFIRDIKRNPRCQKAKLDFKLHNLNDQFGEYYYGSCALDIKIKNEKQMYYVGEGRAKSSHEALIVAYAEAVERMGVSLQGRIWSSQSHGKIFNRYSIEMDVPDSSRNSNGAAVHTLPLAAVRNGLNEILERDAFLIKWYSGGKFPEIPIEKKDPLAKFAKIYEKLGWSIRRFSWPHDKVKTNATAIFFVRKYPQVDQWNFFMGTASDQDFEKSSSKAFQEAAASFRYFTEKFQRVDTQQPIKKKDLEKIIFRLFLYQKPEMLKVLQSRFGPKKAIKRINVMEDKEFITHCMTQLKDIKIQPLPIPKSLKDHLFCVKVHSRSLQDLDWQMKPKINSHRLKKSQVWSKLNRFPHPLY